MNSEDHDRIAVIIAFAEAIMVLRDPHEDGHAKRAAILAGGLARELDMPDGFVANLEYATRLHDVGKVAIAEHVLNKKRLTTSEKKMIDSHAELGAKMIRALNFDNMIQDVIHYHHENWDGSGYPDRLIGEEIPIGARILRIVDCFDAMTSERSYRRLFLRDEALALMEVECGLSFDPKIFPIFQRMILR